MSVTPINIEAVEKGIVLDLTEASDRRIRASIIRDVLRDIMASCPDPRSLRLQEAQVEGDLDLNDVRTIVPMSLESCVFTGAIQPDRAHT